MSFKSTNCLILIMLSLNAAAFGAVDSKIVSRQSNTVRPEPRTDTVWLNRQAQIESSAKKAKADVLFLGDSITEGWGLTSAWQKYFHFSAFNAGITGDRTEHVLWRVKQGLIKEINPKLVVLLVGTNNVFMNKPEDTFEGIKDIIEEIHSQVPTTKVLVLGILPSGETPDSIQRKKNIEVNRLLEPYARTHNDYYFDSSALFVDEKGMISKATMPDFLHPTTRSYYKWAQALNPLIEQILKQL